MTARDARRQWREQQLAQRRQRFHPDVAQGPLERFVLLRPDRTLSAEVMHVQWMDNHPAGPDTHAMVSFADGTNVEFAFGTPVVKVRLEDAAHVTPEELDSAAPAHWGREAGRWDDDHR